MIERAVQERGGVMRQQATVKSILGTNSKCARCKTSGKIAKVEIRTAAGVDTYSAVCDVCERRATGAHHKPAQRYSAPQAYTSHRAHTAPIRGVTLADMKARIRQIDSDPR
jgi:transcription elongation factor Elf1